MLVRSLEARIIFVGKRGKTKRQQEVIKQVQKQGKTVHFATLMDLQKLRI